MIRPPMSTVMPMLTLILACAGAAAAPAAGGGAAAPRTPPSPAQAQAPQLPPSPATTRAPTPAPATQPSPQELHEQAIDLMRIGQLDGASKLMEKGYNALPPAQRTRPLVLNRAILDLSQKTFNMRAVRDLYQYLRAHPEPDEQAQNILGTALNLAAETPRIKQGALWQSAYKEWERRNDQLNESRPGFRRWGPDWLGDAQYEELHAARLELERAIEEQEAQTAHAKRKFDELQAQRAQLASDLTALRNNIAMVNPPGSARAGAAGSVAVGNGGIQIDQGQLDRVNLQREMNLREAQAREMGALREAESRAAAQAPGLKADWDLEQTRLATLKTRLLQMRPAWPATFDPIDPSALQPPPIPPPDPKAVAALAQKLSTETAKVKSPFGDANPTTRPASAPAPAPASPGPAEARPLVATVPATQPAPPADVPFGPREIDKQRSR